MDLPRELNMTYADPSSLPTAEQSLILVADGRAGCTIVVPDTADSGTRMAAGWLGDYVRAALCDKEFRFPDRHRAAATSRTPGYISKFQSYLL